MIHDDNGDNDDDNPGEIYYDHTNNDMNFRVGTNVRWSVSDSSATLSHGQLILSGTGRIQGVDTVSAGTDAANKTYVDKVLKKISEISGVITSFLSENKLENKENLIFA